MNTWAEFQRAYSAQVRGMSHKIFKSYKVPAAVSPEDIEQEVWAGAWTAWNAWNPERGKMERHAFTMCCAKQYASRWVHTQRNALRRAPKAASRIHEPRELIDTADNTLPTQEAACAFAQAVQRVLAALRAEEREALRALIDNAFDVDLTVKALRPVMPDYAVARQVVGKTARNFQRLMAEA